jgi:dienelactone hydrolase family protein
LLAVLALSSACSHERAASGAPGTTASSAQTTTTGHGTTTSETSARLDGCVGKRDGRRVELRIAATHLDGVVLGHGQVGVVLAHEKGDDLCSWLPYAHHLARLGFTALAFDFKTYAAGLVESVVAAAHELRREGASGIVLIGASMGGTAVLDAAGKVPGILGVVSASGPASYGDANAATAVRTLRAPLLFIVAHDDAEFLGDARSLYRHARSPDKKLEVLPGFAHGTGFFAAPLSGPALRLTDRFVSEHGRQ